MAGTVAPPPIQKPDIVVPDAAPSIHLASAGLSHLPHEVGAAVVVVDVVAREITRDAVKPGAEVLAARLAEGRAPGSDRPVRVEETETGRPTVVRNQSLDADIDVLTTRAFLDGVERRERVARGNASGVPGPG